MELETLQDVFKNRAFKIPLFQRGYAWQQVQRQDLLDDLDDVQYLAPDKKHYMGTLVLKKGKLQSVHLFGETFDVLEVIDGQQRLVTLVVLLQSVLDALHSVGTPEAKLTADTLRREYVQTKTLLKVQFDESVNRFFQDHILKDEPGAEPLTPTHENLLCAKSEFREYLKKKNQAIPNDRESGWLTYLQELVRRVTNRLGFALYEVESEAEVGMIFEALNARGKALTEFEKIKNYLLYASGKTPDDEARALESEISDTWRKVSEKCFEAGEGDEDQLLRYQWAIYKEHRPPEMYRAVKAMVRELQLHNHNRGVGSAISSYLGSLRQCSVPYRDLFKPADPAAFGEAGGYREQLSAHAMNIQRLNRLGPVMPLLMASYLKFGREWPQLVAEIFRLCEVFCFRLIAYGRRADAGESYADSLGSRVISGQLSAEEAGKSIRELVRNYCTDDQLKASLADPDFNFYDWIGIRYFLFEYERHLVERAGKRMLIDWDEFYKRDKAESIEHVLPQGESTLKRQYWRDRYTEEAWKRDRHRLGNLALTRWNSSYGNKGFDEKRGGSESAPDAKVYFNSQYLSERELAQRLEWTEKEIADRQGLMVDFAAQRWGV